ncbi:MULTISPECIES: ABC transporter permease [Paenibacillus]|uniref:ABC transporter permease n=1 Tax=Paenibacillus TaxID=44249 RepID=UPI0020162754|nr:ABC transporter permease [Paenibacillus odorifer]MEC0221141.1 ABC transporter permease [Paenibacillus odorifer]
MKALLKLISLEIRKNKLKTLLTGAAIVNLAILAFMIMVLFVDQNESEPSFASYAELFEGVFVFVKAAYIIFASVIISKLVIDEYKNNTITLLFMYPISRKKLMTAKILIVFAFTFVAIIVADIVVGAILIGFNSFAGLIPGELTLHVITSELIKLGANAFYAAGIALIPLYFGMKKKSVPATIVSAVLVTSLISGGFDQARLGNLAAVSISLGLLGAAIAYMAIRNIEHKDIA